MKKRLIQYVVLAALLVGVPLACAWLGGRPVAPWVYGERESR